jgi:hypothetical protein
MAGFLSRLFGIFGRRKTATSQYALADVYEGLRQNILVKEPRMVGASSSAEEPLWGILMETGYSTAVATLVAMADGTVSLYFSNGGGIIGLGQHEAARKAGQDLLAAATAYLGHAQKTTSFPLPDEGHARFYFLASSATYVADALEDSLGNNQHPLSPLFYKAQEVITQARLIDEMRQNPTAGMLHAATTGDTDALHSLLGLGTSPDVADDTGLTPLMAASYAGMVPAQKVLLNSGAQVDATDSSGYTALMFACNAGQTDCVRLLIKRGADVNCGDNDLSTPIMFAAQHGHNEIVRLLLASGADPQAQGRHGLSAVGVAQQNGHAETEEILTAAE